MFKMTSDAPFAFHISRQTREKFALNAQLFQLSGNVIFADFHAARVLAQQINANRHPGAAIRASELYAMGLIDEVLHKIIDIYRTTVNPNIIADAEQCLEERFNRDIVRQTYLRFVEHFPPLQVYRNEITAAEYLAMSTAGVENRHLVLEELLVLWMANNNPAFGPFREELFADDVLAKETAYLNIVAELQTFLEEQPGYGADKTDLFTLLREPALKSPYDLAGQLRFLLERWGAALQDMIVKVLGTFDFIREETRPIFGGPGPSEPVTFELGDDEEAERFSADLHWMPRLVLIAKSTLVWLDQLSKRYGRQIRRLNEIPDEEITRLAKWGFTGLWLIGIWQRSEASKWIKQTCGNPQAEASAYALFDYEMSAELGGEEALQDLRARCWQKGIRLACDMVPNHTGIDSKWTREHPDWFLSAPHSPFPSYRFHGQNLSADERYRIYIEDGYYDQTDAAVVFKREDTWTGDVRYIYHGNDGTGMPWNDTAQLDYLKPEVREAAIRKIVDVVRRFPIVRFDAAMTLAKKHIQRLWYPQPGCGGDIPSRAQYAMSRKEFNEKMPYEFWREVVDRVAVEVPDSLLLAEAFWFMEGYFVRTLGMHRVYNSAFMNMLKNEENQKYRQTVINTLQFNPQVLKRYVNFMNNPDEDTAIAQFGDHDKYFGVCTLLVTMPGLPMFGHGQVEGLHEKYGMEYSRAYYDEVENHGLIQRHESQIFPLMRQRYLFAEVDKFLFYDFHTSLGTVNDNVFAYSNNMNGWRSLVLYHNRYEETAGWLRISVAFKADWSDDLVQQSLGQGLSLSYDEDAFLIFRDQLCGLQYLRRSRQVCDEGLYFELGAYACVVVTDMSEVRDDAAGSYGRLCEMLSGRGVPSIEDELAELRLWPFLQEIEQLLTTQFARFQAALEKPRKDNKEGVPISEDQLVACYRLSPMTSQQEELEKVAIARVCEHFQASIQLLRWAAQQTNTPSTNPVLLSLANAFEAVQPQLLYCFSLLQMFLPTEMEEGDILDDVKWLDEWRIGNRVERFAEAAGVNSAEVVTILKIMLSLTNWHRKFEEPEETPQRLLTDLFDNVEVRRYARVNQYSDVWWYDKEQANTLFKWLLVMAAVDLCARQKISLQAPGAEGLAALKKVADITRRWSAVQAQSEYKLSELLRLCADDLA